jgi:hypothetical protein
LSTANAPTPAERAERQREIEARAEPLDRIADRGLRTVVANEPQIERVFSDLAALGARASDSLVSNAHRALSVFD